ncbi:unnamed protein product [Echinostoma caproni]|uniref:Nudix hydrolase domain-containing protein n=1 Tax=Echinostoma caproni TaxID=27848 RepID=A0A183AKC7_9TREM|nr:unnamed protein product [Echinostoma caproni]
MAGNTFANLWKLASQKCNNFLLPGSSRCSCCKFLVDGYFVGLIRPDVIPSLLTFPSVFVWTVQPETGERCITLHPALNTFDARSSAVGDVMLDLRSTKTFKALDGWRNEDYGVYIGDRQQPLLRLERSASSLLGVVRYGVHVNGYFIKRPHDLNGLKHSTSNGSTVGNGKRSSSPVSKGLVWDRALGDHDPSTVMMWLGVRAMNKPTWPGMLDNMAAGGLTFGLDALGCARKECQEEASVPEDLLNTLTAVSRLSPVDLGLPAHSAMRSCYSLRFRSLRVSYVFEDERGVCPQVEYCYDLELPDDFVPVGADGEVDSFHLVSITQLKDLIFSDRFKANSALVILDFLYRHKFIDPSSGGIGSILWITAAQMGTGSAPKIVWMKRSKLADVTQPLKCHYKSTNGYGCIAIKN